MDDGLKQRLIGAIVLVSVAVIFVPILFDQDRKKTQDILVDIPARPDIPKLDFKKPTAPSKNTNADGISKHCLRLRNLRLKAN